ncbi:MAG: hypothetical protein ABSD76_13990 [Terriglobales bacterium]|jgi:hypothetical protein
MSLTDRALLALAVLWTIFTVVSLGVITALIVTESGVPLGLGWIRTNGLAGLWITVPSALLGIAGLTLLNTRRTTGFRLLLCYSGLFTVTLVPAVLRELPTIVRHPLAYCADGKCTPWVITVSITVAFTLSTLWYARQAYLRGWAEAKHFPLQQRSRESLSSAI